MDRERGELERNGIRERETERERERERERQTDRQTDRQREGEREGRRERERRERRGEKSGNNLCWRKMLFVINVKCNILVFEGYYPPRSTYTIKTPINH